MTSPFLPFHVPEIGDEEKRAVLEVLESGWLTTGAKVRQFEQDFAAYTGAAHAVALNSGTAALHLALDAIGLKEGDEVIVPTLTFTATAEVVLYFKARPVLVDCEADTLNIDPRAIEPKLSPRTKAIIPVHIAGQPCDLDPILELARARNLAVIEDAAHALPARYRGKKIGTVGDITCFSFYATKTITTAEGGMATTDNAAWAERMRMMSLHGISKDAWKRYTSEGSWYYEVHAPGFKYNLTDLAAALGIEQLKKCDRFWRARENIAARYDEAFADLPEIVRPAVRPSLQHARHLYIIQLGLERITIDRNRFIEALKEKGIGTSVHFIPLHLHPFYRDVLGYSAADFPRATAAYQRIVSLPIYPKMTPRDVDRVTDAVRDVVSAHRR
ncbi:MAG TPA: DegT/DnrJ/EryC1/StrS family aminotransferase [Candidatus Eisenbacteria bacterium]|nr:DegT/DnrJ/EryC1/StrS family aminotransferase [Candidatus Eisenbacteria bacterium]